MPSKRIYNKLITAFFYYQILFNLISGVYLAATLCVAALATLVTVGILFIYHKDGEPDSDSLLCTLSRSVGKYCCVLGLGDEETDQIKDSAEGASQEGANKEGGNELSWANIAEIWDRVCFYAFVVITVLVNFIFIIILVVGGQLSSQA